MSGHSLLLNPNTASEMPPKCPRPYSFSEILHVSQHSQMSMPWRTRSNRFAFGRGHCRAGAPMICWPQYSFGAAADMLWIFQPQRNANCYLFSTAMRERALQSRCSHGWLASLQLCFNRVYMHDLHMDPFSYLRSRIYYALLLPICSYFLHA